jgi:hypothetical protein
MSNPRIAEQQSRVETYRGVQISVVANRQQPSGSWTWTYVAGDLIGSMRGAQLPNADAALTRGHARGAGARRSGPVSRARLMSLPRATLAHMEDDEDSGILARVPGQYIARASRSLPEPATSLAERVSAVIDAEWAGVVRIDYVRQRMRHGRSSHWAWVAIRAEPQG